MKLAFIILAHRDPDHVTRLAKHLLESGAVVAIHYDLNAPPADLATLRAALAPWPTALFVERIVVNWGHWSIVRATLDAIATLQATGVTFDYVHLLSGVDYPIRPVAWFERFLGRNEGREFIDVANIRKRRWVIGGLEHERYRYHHIHNWQTEPKKFDRYWARQRDRKQIRKFLPDLDPHLGLQWWTLTWATCLGALQWSREEGISAFFETVWIPDEMFFQTYVGNNISPDSLGRPLSYCQFDRDGMPIVYYDDHADFLKAQKSFFARKISPSARALRDSLDLYLAALQAGSPQAEEEPEQYAGLQQTLERHRWGLADRRRIGYAGDPWYGDLEWNRDPYIVIASPSRAATRRSRKVLETVDFMICHGELFAPDATEFAGSRAQFAGYRADDMALRDHKPPNFVTDVIKAGAPAITCFFMTPNGAGQISEVLIWDPRAHFVTLQADIFETFNEWLRERASPLETFLEEIEDGKLGIGNGRGSARFNGEFQGFARKVLADHARALAALAQRLSGAGKRALALNEMDEDWLNRLKLFAVEISNLQCRGEFPRPRELAKGETVSEELPPRPRRGNGILDFGDGVKPHVIAFVLTKVDERLVEALARAAPYLEWIAVRYAALASATDYAVVCKRYGLEELGAAVAAPLLDRMIRDPRSRILLLRGRAIDLLADFVEANGSLDGAGIVAAHPQDIDKGGIVTGSQQFFGKMRTSAATHGKAALEIDLAAPGWFAELTAFIKTMFDGNPPGSLDEGEIAAASKERGYPFRSGAGGTR